MTAFKEGELEGHRFFTSDSSSQPSMYIDTGCGVESDLCTALLQPDEKRCPMKKKKDKDNEIYKYIRMLLIPLQQRFRHGIIERVVTAIFRGGFDLQTGESIPTVESVSARGPWPLYSIYSNIDGYHKYTNQ